MEDGPESHVKLKQDIHMRGATNLKNATSAIRLSEIGPRLKLKLVKIEEGICDGEVLYHESITKTPEEISIIREKSQNRKKAEKIKQKDEKLTKGKKGKTGNRKDKKTRENLSQYANPKDLDYDEAKENREYYKQELGEDPDDTFEDKSKFKKRKREQNDPNEDAKLLKSSGYDKFLENDKPNKKKFKSTENSDETSSKDFSVKFEKNNKPKKSAKFFKLSNKKAGTSK